MLKAITTWLASEADLEIGVTLYAGNLPAKDKNGAVTPDKCVTLRELGVERINPYNTAKRAKPVQVIARDKDYFGAYDEAVRICGLFANQIRPSGISGWVVKTTQGDGPQYMPTENARGLHHFVFNVLVKAEKEG